jgi:hypothetical protein
VLAIQVQHDERRIATMTTPTASRLTVGFLDVAHFFGARKRWEVDEFLTEWDQLSASEKTELMAEVRQAREQS